MHLGAALAAYTKAGRPLVSYRHPVGCCRSPGNSASRVTHSIGECRMSLWSTMVVSIPAHGSGGRREPLACAGKIPARKQFGPRVVHGPPKVLPAGTDITREDPRCVRRRRGCRHCGRRFYPRCLLDGCTSIGYHSAGRGPPSAFPVRPSAWASLWPIPRRATLGPGDQLSVGGLMPRSMVGLLTAVGTAMSALVSLAHGGYTWASIAVAAATLGLAAYLALLPQPLVLPPIPKYLNEKKDN
jgi:hypothetical protein